MELNSVKLVYFSATQTTEKVLKAVVRGMNGLKVRNLDLTGPDAVFETEENEKGILYIFGAPVYGGRLPRLAAERLRKIKGAGAPAAAIVVYGNHDFGDALLELRDLIKENGFMPVAGAAFIGEHSFSNEKLPIAKGRPDAADLSKAREFGTLLSDKLKRVAQLDEKSLINVPGKVPYKEYHPVSGIAPLTDTGLCSQCELCVDLCPTKAIRLEDEGIVSDADICIVCFACIKNCPSEARKIDAPRVQKVAQWLCENCQARKEPKVFF